VQFNKDTKTFVQGFSGFHATSQVAPAFVCLTLFSFSTLACHANLFFALENAAVSQAPDEFVLSWLL
jgi:hypothetical protein